MLLKYILLSIFVLGLHKEVLCRECNDCIKYTFCKPAKYLLDHKRDDDTRAKFRSAYCGRDENDNKYKVCCSDFDDVELEFRSNLNLNTSGDDKLKLLPDECGDFQGSRIVGGEMAKLYEFPWMALILYNTTDGLKFQCGGSIINKRYILTAAHCVQDTNLVAVRVGELDISTLEDCQEEADKIICESHLQDVYVEEQIVHENFATEPYPKHDIALLRVDEDIEFRKNVAPICLPISVQLRNKFLAGELSTVAGWGFTELGRESAILRKVKVPIKTDETCRTLYNRLSRNGENRIVDQLCAGTVKKDSCGGDSGGPLMLLSNYKDVDRYVQFGVVSYGPARCGSNFPGVYTDVRKYVDWILDKIQA